MFQINDGGISVVTKKAFRNWNIFLTTTILPAAVHRADSILFQGQDKNAPDITI
jgi:hypothetical protein